MNGSVDEQLRVGDLRLLPRLVGNTHETQIAASDGAYGLLGTMLLNGRRLAIDYAAKTAEIT